MCSAQKDNLEPDCKAKLRNMSLVLGTIRNHYSFLSKVVKTDCSLELSVWQLGGAWEGEEARCWKTNQSNATVQAKDDECLNLGACDVKGKKWMDEKNILLMSQQ